MARKTDSEMIGYRKGTLTVIAFDSLRKGRSYWNVQCDCGEIKTLRIDGMHDYSTCDKCKAEKQRQRMLTHGETKTSLYKTWQGIKERCYNPKSPSYSTYGERNIKMFDEWISNYKSFSDYVKTLPNYNEKGYSIDRIDVNKGYEPGNIRWADSTTQANNRRDNVFVEFNGEVLTAKQWSVRLGMNYRTIMNRIKMGWSVEDILTRPVEKHARAVSS
jgi:hypothetical protein